MSVGQHAQKRPTSRRKTGLARLVAARHFGSVTTQVTGTSLTHHWSGHRVACAEAARVEKPE